MKVQSIVTFSDIILYWELTQYKEYTVFVNGKEIGKTKNTHYQIRNLKEKNQHLVIYTEDNTVFYENEFILPDKPKMIDVTSQPFCAKGDGVTLNTEALQGAIDACGKNECVYIPKGVFLTGALTLHSNMQLYIEKGGVLQGSDNPADYLPKIFSRFEGLEMECYRSLINMGDIKNREAIACENVLIYGGGKIDGNGMKLRQNVIDTEKELLRDYMESLGEEIKTYENSDTIPGRLRPKLVNISCSKNIVMDNIEFYNGACWNVHMIYSNNIVTSCSTIYSHGISNGDGWDPDSSENCTIFGCRFDTGDDCVAIKSGKNPEGNIISKPTRHVRVFDCKSVVSHGITIGSEMSGGVEDVKIWNCDIENSSCGLEIKGTKKRGGYVKNVYVKNVKTPRIWMHSVLYNDDGEGAPTPPVFSDCVFEDMFCTGKSVNAKLGKVFDCEAIELCGFEEGYEIQNIKFKNITLSGNAAMRINFEFVKNISVENLNIQ